MTVVVAVAYAVALLATGVVTALKRKWFSLAVGFVFSPVWIVAAIRLAKPGSWWARRYYDDAKRERARARLRDPFQRTVAAVGLALSLVITLAAIVFVVPYKIPSSAMEPTLRCARPSAGCEGRRSDRVAALRFVFSTRVGRGDIVAYRSTQAQEQRCGGGGTYVHRIVALPGERVGSRGETIIVDGEPLDEPYVARERRGTEGFSPVQLSPNAYFVLGDNRKQSCDSRVWGALPEQNLVARVVAVYWPPERIGLP